MALTLAFFSSFKTKRIRVAQWDTAATFSLPPTASSRALASFSNFLIMSPFMKKNIFDLYVQIVYGIIVTDFQIKCKLFFKKIFF